MKTPVVWRGQSLPHLPLSPMLSTAYFLTLAIEFESVLPLLLELVPVLLISVLLQVCSGLVISLCFIVVIQVNLPKRHPSGE